MKKLVKGIVDFRKKLRPEYLESFRKLALGQAPDTLFIACSDSRVVPNLFASTDPGDLFVIRNVGNLIPPVSDDGLTLADEAEAAAIEFSLTNLPVKHIVVCGHSECAAMYWALEGREKLKLPNLKSWLRLTGGALRRLEGHIQRDSSLSPQNQLSQMNVLLQLDHLMSYPQVRSRVTEGTLQVHGWWFDIATAEVHCFERESGSFVLIDEREAQSILERLDQKQIMKGSFLDSMRFPKV